MPNSVRARVLYDRSASALQVLLYPKDFAERTFKQIEGFGSYGFPESHAASFAKIAYASCWVKHHHPDVFCAGLLNAQPMGFYAPAQIVADARKHDRIIDHDNMLRSIWRTPFTIAPGRGDGATSGGGPDPRDPTFPRGRTLGSPPFRTVAEQEEILRIRSHDFH